MTTKEALEALEALHNSIDFRFPEAKTAYTKLKDYLEDLESLEEDARKFNEEVDSCFLDQWKEEMNL